MINYKFTETDMLIDSEMEAEYQKNKPVKNDVGKKKSYTGKYKGLSIEEIAGMDLDYLYCVIDNFDSLSKFRYNIIRFFQKNDIPFKSVLTGKILKY